MCYMGLAKIESIPLKKKKLPVVLNNPEGSGVLNHPFQLKDWENGERTAQVK